MGRFKIFMTAASAAVVLALAGNATQAQTGSYQRYHEASSFTQSIASIERADQFLERLSKIITGHASGEVGRAYSVHTFDRAEYDPVLDSLTIYNATLTVGGEAKSSSPGLTVRADRIRLKGSLDAEHYRLELTGVQSRIFGYPMTSMMDSLINLSDDYHSAHSMDIVIDFIDDGIVRVTQYEIEAPHLMSMKMTIEVERLYAANLNARTSVSKFNPIEWAIRTLDFDFSDHGIIDKVIAEINSKAYIKSNLITRENLEDNMRARLARLNQESIGGLDEYQANIKNDRHTRMLEAAIRTLKKGTPIHFVYTPDQAQPVVYLWFLLMSSPDEILKLIDVFPSVYEVDLSSP